MTKDEIQKNSEHWYNKYKDAEKRIEELELELTVEKDQHQEEINLHLHAEDYIKSLEQQIEKMKCCGNCRFSESDTLNGTFCHREGCFVVASAKCKLWEM